MTHAFTAVLTAIILLLFIAIADDAGHQKDSNCDFDKSLDHSKRINK